MPGQQTKYQKNWENQYPWVRSFQKDVYRAFCNVCGTDFSISNQGKTTLEKHQKNVTHLGMLKASSSNKKITTMLPSIGQNDVAAKEATLVFHTICENQSFNSMTCLSKIIRTVFEEKKFACSRTKSAAIARNVFYPMVTESIRNELNIVRFISVATDSSNHGSTKLYPIVFRYFIPMEGVRTRMVDLKEMPSEKASDIRDMLVEVIADFDCDKKLVGFCGDNCPTNFGRPITRTGSNNVFYLLRQKYGDKILGIGCLAHMLHNAINSGCTVVLPHDMEAVIVKFYKHFYIYSQRTEALRVLCDSNDVLFEKLKTYGATRFVAMKDCLKTIINLFDILVEYFDHNSNETPVILKRFLDDPLALFLLQFLHDS